MADIETLTVHMVDGVPSTLEVKYYGEPLTVQYEFDETGAAAFSDPTVTVVMANE